MGRCRGSLSGCAKRLVQTIARRDLKLSLLLKLRCDRKTQGRSGREVKGGAEFHRLQSDQRMAKYWKTEVLTTCALDYMSWDNFYQAGPEEIVAPTIRQRRSRFMMTSFTSASSAKEKNLKRWVFVVGL